MRRVGSRWMDRSGPLVVGFLLLSTLVAGCLEDPDPRGGIDRSSLAIYEYRFQDDDVMHPDHPYGWMVRVTNGAQRPADVRVLVNDTDTAWGPVGDDGWSSEQRSEPVSLEGGGSVLYLFQRKGDPVEVLEYGVQLVEPGASPGPDEEVLASEWRNRSLEQATIKEGVAANHHVTTRTVGVWANGTSFYTNIRELNDDPAFPAGYDREGFGGDDLRVYVYDLDSSEQPAGSRDRCFFVTIEGYNDLLKSQAEGTSNVRFLQPEEAYTREGAEDHDLYGDALIFLTHVVAHVGAVTPLQAAPQPTGDCFDPENHLPELPV